MIKEKYKLMIKKVRFLEIFAEDAKKIGLDFLTSVDMFVNEQINREYLEFFYYLKNKYCFPEYTEENNIFYKEGLKNLSEINKHLKKCFDEVGSTDQDLINYSLQLIMEQQKNKLLKPDTIGKTSVKYNTYFNTYGNKPDKNDIDINIDARYSLESILTLVNYYNSGELKYFNLFKSQCPEFHKTGIITLDNLKIQYYKNGSFKIDGLTDPTDFIEFLTQI